MGLWIKGKLRSIAFTMMKSRGSPGAAASVDQLMLEFHCYNKITVCILRYVVLNCKLPVIF
uniref:Uncharacterized protein n=1 Tax=Rhizophora mucronata TaxID=61149 RepID=A0A2P2K2H2_RHIMU